MSRQFRQQAGRWMPRSPLAALPSTIQDEQNRPRHSVQRIRDSRKPISRVHPSHRRGGAGLCIPMRFANGRLGNALSHRGGWQALILLSRTSHSMCSNLRTLRAVTLPITIVRNADDHVLHPTDGGVLRELKQLEGCDSFRCAECNEMFTTLLQWADQALANHRDTNPGFEPIRTQ
jgi:hypothetical protein